MSILLALQGAPTGATVSIAWTQGGDTWNATASGKASLSVSWVQSDAVWSGNAVAKDGLSISYAQADSAWAITAASKASATLAWVGGGDTWAVSANGSSGASATVAWTQSAQVWNETVIDSAQVSIAWTQDDSVWAITANEQSQQIATKGGFSPYSKARIFKQSDKDELIAEISKLVIGEVTTEQVVETVKEVIAHRDFESEIAQYQLALEKTRAILQRIIDAELDDEESILMML